MEIVFLFLFFGIIIIVLDWKLSVLELCFILGMEMLPFLVDGEKFLQASFTNLRVARNN